MTINLRENQRGNQECATRTPPNKLEGSALTFHSALRKLNTEPSIGASHQVLVHLAKQLQRRVLKIEPSETEWPVVAMFISGWALNEQSL